MAAKKQYIMVYNAEKEIAEKVEVINKTKAEWQKELPPDVFHVTREQGTECAFSGEYTQPKQAGWYECVCCGNDLFRSREKFDSGTGWPSFLAPLDERNICMREDTSHGMRRTEIICARCGAHLGHVFADGPPPTHHRYCINSLALRFVPQKRQ